MGNDNADYSMKGGAAASPARTVKPRTTQKLTSQERWRKEALARRKQDRHEAREDRHEARVATILAAAANAGPPPITRSHSVPNELTYSSNVTNPNIPRTSLKHHTDELAKEFLLNTKKINEEDSDEFNSKVNTMSKYLLSRYFINFKNPKNKLLYYTSIINSGRGGTASAIPADQQSMDEKDVEMLEEYFDLHRLQLYDGGIGVIVGMPLDYYEEGNNSYDIIMNPSKTGVMVIDPTKIIKNSSLSESTGQESLSLMLARQNSILHEVNAHDFIANIEKLPEYTPPFEEFSDFINTLPWAISGFQDFINRYTSNSLRQFLYRCILFKFCVDDPKTQIQMRAWEQMNNSATILTNQLEELLKNLPVRDITKVAYEMALAANKQTPTIEEIKYILNGALDRVNIQLDAFAEDARKTAINGIADTIMSCPCRRGGGGRGCTVVGGAVKTKKSKPKSSKGKSKKHLKMKKSKKSKKSKNSTKKKVQRKKPKKPLSASRRSQ